MLVCQYHTLGVCHYFLFTEKYFDMKKVQCKEGLDIYKKFLTRMARISEFLKVAEVSQDPGPGSHLYNQGLGSFGLLAPPCHAHSESLPSLCSK